jgi:hypothetical protein
MAILIHVLIALSSLVYSTLVVVFPSDAKLKVSYGLIAATLISGFYLVISLPAHLLSSCISGLVYLAFALSASWLSRYRLASQKSHSSHRFDD